MVLFLFTLAIALAGLAAIEFGQPARPREITAWSDERERRMLRVASRRNDWW